MALSDELETYVKDTFAHQWNKRDGRKVPESEDVGLGNEAVLLEGTVLYADLAGSTKMVDSYKNYFAAEVYKNYLYCAARLVRAYDGSITAYDGDRIMAVFVGDAKNSNAAKCGLKINYVVKKIIQPALKAQYPNSTYVLEQTVGIDTSSLFVARTGIRGANDLVWVGRAANYAAKLSDLSTVYATYITEDVYKMLNEKSKYSSGKDMWTRVFQSDVDVSVYGSTYWWEI